MANKKRKKQRSRQRPAVTPAAPGGAGLDVSASTVTPTAPAPAAPARPASPATSSYAAGISGPRRTQGGTAAAATAAIDIDTRVPYFASDLRRVLITAGVMIVLIVGGSLLIK